MGQHWGKGGGTSAHQTLPQVEENTKRLAKKEGSSEECRRDESSLCHNSHRHQEYHHLIIAHVTGLDAGKGSAGAS